MEYQRQLKSSVETAQDMASVLYWTLRLLAGVIVTYVGTVFLARPIYATLCGTVCWLLLKYVLNADSMWHKSQHLENQFWMLISFMLSSTLMFAPDSPYLAASWFPSNATLGRVLGCFVVVGTTMTAHFLDKHHHRTRLRTLPSLVAFDELIQNSSANEIVKMVNGYVGELDHTLPSTFATMWNISKFMRIERSILGVFNNCSREELNYIIVRTEMKLITYKLKNHTQVTATAVPAAKRNRCRSELLDILARRRISELNLASRAVVLDVIQGLRLSIHPDTAKEAQEWIFNLLSTVRGDELSELKQLVDNKGSAESMHKLVYDHVVDQAMRDRILQHFRKQASIQAAQMAMGSSLARKRLQRGAWRKILSDVDDTLFSSGGRYPAGIDISYKRKVFYPAVTSLYRELNIGSRGALADAGVWPPKRSGDLVFLSARPHVYKDVTETTMYSKFRGFIRSQALHCMPSLLPGDLESGQAFMMQGTFMPMARKKLRNFEEYYSIYPEYTHVFIGDNGQADVKAAEYMVEKFGTKVVERVYIHEVQPREFTFGYEAGASEQRWHQSGIVFCRTYVRAALDAAQQGLIRFHGLRRVAVAAHEDFQRIKATWSDPYERDIRRLELNDDLESANKALVGAGLPSTGIIHGDAAFVVGSLVHTMFGKGYVASYRTSTGVYEIILDWGASSQSAPRLYSQLHGLFANEKGLRDVQRRLFRPRSRTENLTQITDSLSRGRTSRSSSSISRPGDLVPPNDETIREAFTASLYKVDKPRHYDPFSSFLMPVMFYPGRKSRATSLRKRASTETRTPRRPSMYSVGDTNSETASLAAKKRPSSAERPASATTTRSEPSLVETSAPTAVQDVLAGLVTPLTPQKPRTPDSSAGGSDAFAEEDDEDEDEDEDDINDEDEDEDDGAAALNEAALEGASARPQSSSGMKTPTQQRSALRTESVGSALGAYEHAQDASEKLDMPVEAVSDEEDAVVSEAPAAHEIEQGEEEVEVILELGTRVKTPFGTAVVLHFRERDSIYETAIPSMNALAYFSEDSLLMWNANLFEERAQRMVSEGSYPRRLFGLMTKLFTRGGETRVDDMKDASGSSRNSSSKKSNESPSIKNGSVVKTPYGQGLVLDVRSSGMLELKLLWASRAYVSTDCVTLDDKASDSDSENAAKLLQLDQSPLQKARELISKNWELLKLPFSVMQRGRISQGLPSSSSSAPTGTTTLPSSDSLLSLCSLVTAASGTSSDTYLSALDEAYGIRIGDVVDTNGFGMGEVQEIRPDGFFVITLPFGRAYIHVPRLLLGGGVPHAGPTIPVGAQVITPFGMGVIDAFREEDGVYAVSISNASNLKAYIASRPNLRGSTSSMSLLSSASSSARKNADADASAAANSGSIKSSILSFITNIIHYPKADAGKEENGKRGSDAQSGSDARSTGGLSWHNVPLEGTAVPPGHTEFSWYGNSFFDDESDDEEDDDGMGEDDSDDSGVDDELDLNLAASSDVRARDEGEDEDATARGEDAGAPAALSAGSDHEDGVAKEVASAADAEADKLARMAASIPPGHTVYSWTGISEPLQDLNSYKSEWEVEGRGEREGDDAKAVEGESEILEPGLELAVNALDAVKSSLPAIPTPKFSL